MALVNNIEIIFLYSSNAGRELYFSNLVQEKDVMDIEHYTPPAFWGISGGLEITINDYCSVFSSTDFHYLIKATSFLINSAYWIKGKKSEWFDKDDDYPEDIVLRTTDNRELRLVDNGSDEIQISFTPKGRIYGKERGIHYFENIIVKKNDWNSGVTLALNEYFQVLLKIIQNDPNDQTNKTMLAYYDVWKQIEKELI